MIVPPGDAAATAAPMVEKQPALPPGFTQDLLNEASAGWQIAVISIAPARDRGETNLRRFQECLEDMLTLIEFPPIFSQLTYGGARKASRAKRFCDTCS